MTQRIVGEELFAPDENAVSIYRALARSIVALDAVEVVASRSHVAFRARRGFAYAWAPEHYVKSDVPVGCPAHRGKSCDLPDSRRSPIRHHRHGCITWNFTRRTKSIPN